MKQKLLRLTAMLMFGCMVASSVPTGIVQAEESVQADGSEEPVQEQAQTEGGTDGNADSNQSMSQDGTENPDKAAGQPSDSISQNNPADSNASDTSDASDDSALDENETSVSGEAKDNIASQDDSEEAESEAAAQSDVTEKSGADHSQEDSVIEKNANEINYVFVERPYLETPGTERIAVSYGDGSESVSDATLTVRDDAGEETVWDLSVSAGQVYLFTNDFSDDSAAGTYEVVSLNVTDEEGDRTVYLSDSGMEAYFGVNEEYDGIDELQPLDIEDADTVSEDESAAVEATVAEIDSDNVEESAEKIADALEEAEEQTDTSDLSASLKSGSSVNGRTASKSISGTAASLMTALGAKIQTVAAANAKSGNGNIVVALDPGHDSKHTGASYGNLKEEVLTLKIAQYCKAELETYSGVTVYMTRTSAACPHPNNSSSGGDIGDRVIAAANAGADIFVSIHLNSSTSSSPNGAEVIIPNSNWKPQVAQEGKELAQAILKELQGVGLNLRPTEIYSKDTTIGEKYPDGSLSDYFSVQIYAKEAGIPGIIVEHAFLTNSGDRAHLDSEADLKELGVADATGIAKYLGLSKGDWRTEGGKTYYYVDGVKVTGAKKIGNAWYYFDPSNNGAMYTGWRTDGSKTYYYDTNGILAIAEKKIGSYWYYFNSNGSMYTGWRFDGNKVYYYDSQGRLAIGKKTIEGHEYYFNSNGTMCTGWRTEGSAKYYYNSSGHMVTGTQKIGSYWYYFNEQGVMHTGWRTADGKQYFYDSEGKLVRDTVVIDGKTYYFNSDGSLFTQGAKKIGGYWYYINSDGSTYVGWRTDGSAKYYYDAEGHLIIGVKKIDGYWYYFSSNGKMYTGWRQDGDKTYYYNTDGPLAIGEKTIDGVKYYFKTNGDAYTGWRTVNGVKSYYSGGRIATGAVKIDGYWYYFEAQGTMHTGWRTDGDNTYYYEQDGHLIRGVKKIDDNWYYFNNNGTMYKGWRTDGNNTYYYDSEGRLARGEMEIDGKVYVFRSNGNLIRQGEVKISGYWYYLNSDGTVYTGWRQDGDKIYYYESNGHLVLGTKKIDGYWYYFKSNGAMYTGWRTDGGNTYYYDGNGHLCIGAKKIDGYWYYFKSNGAMYIGWRTDGNNTYYYDGNGHLAIGEKSIDGNSYYFQSNGNMLTNGFANRKYYGSNGVLVAVSNYGSVFYKIEGNSTTTVDQMVRFYNNSGNTYPSEALGKGGAATIRDLAQIFYEEAAAEGIKAEVVWAQTMHETGYLKFGGQVKIEQFNFAGLGATDGGAAGASFSDVRTGVRAQVQHMKAYASTAALKNACVDPRFNLVTRGSAQYVEILGQKENPTGAGWATNQNYGISLAELITKLKNS